MRARMALVALAASFGMGCASGGAAAGGSSGRTNRDQILEAEISARANEATNALQIIQKLRPQMLRGRGIASPSDVTGESAQPKVYVDNIAYGDLSSLQNVLTSQISEIRFINSRDATTRWGTGHMGGVILVVTRNR